MLRRASPLGSTSCVAAALSAAFTLTASTTLGAAITLATAAPLARLALRRLRLENDSGSDDKHRHKNP